jgi:predicted amidohydrolase YtcJ
MPEKELILINGNIITLSEKRAHAKSLAISGGKIAEIDPSLPGKVENTAAREVTDLEGRTVIPGMADCHVHFTHVGLGLIFPDFRGAGSVSDILDGLSAALKSHPKNEILFGWNFDENLFREKRIPTIEELDKISRQTPIWVNRIGMNASVFNTKAWDTVNLSPASSIIPTGPQGKLLGSISGDANWVALARVLNSLSDEVRLRAFRAAAVHCASKGVTSVHAMEGCFSPNMPDRPEFACLEIPCLTRNKDLINVDLAIWYQHIVDYEKDIALVKKYGLSRIGGDAFADGVLGAAMTQGVLRAALFEPFQDDPSTKGDLLFTDDEIEKFVWLSWKAGLQFSAHAVGDRAISQILRAYERALGKKPGNARFRIEHGILPRPEDMKRAAALGVIFSMQPAFDYYSGGPDGRYAKRVGPERGRLTNPFREIIDAGGMIVGGSDSPVNPIDPLFGMHCMVNHHFPNQRTSRLDALKAFTCDAAYSVFEDDRKGKIEVGKQADLVILSENPLTIDPARLKDIQVEMTIYRGVPTFTKPVQRR